MKFQISVTRRASSHESRNIWSVCTISLFPQTLLISCFVLLARAPGVMWMDIQWWEITRVIALIAHCRGICSQDNVEHYIATIGKELRPGFAWQFAAFWTQVMASNTDVCTLLLKVFISWCRLVNCQDLLTSLPEDVAFTILDKLNFPERLIMSKVCKSWRYLCVAGMDNISIVVTRAPQFNAAQTWMEKAVAGRQAAVKSFTLNAQVSWDSWRYGNISQYFKCIKAWQNKLLSSRGETYFCSLYLLPYLKKLQSKSLNFPFELHHEMFSA